MQNLLNDLATLLATDQRFVIDGKPLKNKIIESALNLDPSLLELLLQNEAIKKYFFQQVGDMLVFDKIKFQRFVSNKQFLPDSYTVFKNKIGLTVGDEFISDKKEVVLSWPYKDCVLEGGQTKEDQKRSEFFWSETIAPDEIDRLLSPKVFTNFKRYTKNGIEEVGTISDNENYIIKGNNLLVLHSLAHIKGFKGKIKLIYIDPPYNTGNDGFNYNDSFNHSSWLTFMKNRLEISRELLAENGLIFIQCDDSEQAYLKVLMDEIFQRENFIATILYRRRKSQANLSKNISPIHDYILCYGKSSLSNLNKITPEINDSEFKNPDNDSRGKYVTMPCTNRGGAKYKIVTPTGKVIEDEWRFKYETYKSLEDDNRLVFPKGGDGKPRYKLFLSEKLKDGVVPNTWWDDISSNQEATREITALFGKNVFSYPKAEKLIKRIIELATVEGEYVLDFHLGSGTTAAVAHKMGRKYIGVEQMDYIETIAVERMKKVIKGEQGGVSELVNWKAGGSFIYCELAQHTQQFIDEISKINDYNESLEMWNRLKNSPYISYLIDNTTLTDDDFRNIDIVSQKRFLRDIIDKNTIYIPFTEMNNGDYSIPQTDKLINEMLYGNN